jgi:Mpv17 / PMP22 family
LLTAPMFHAMYEVLDMALPGSVKGWRAWRNTALQLAVDQFVADPIWLVAFYAMFSVFETGKFLPDQISAQIRRDFVPSLMLTWAVFPAFQLLSFVLLPTKLRVLVLNVVDLGYVAALSFLKHT